MLNQQSISAKAETKEPGNYLPPFFLFNPHLETIFPALIRRVSIDAYIRERIATPDDDFLDLDWLRQGSDKVVIISHGLEGNSKRAYIKGMAKALHANGFDVVAWNFRGCSEEMNRQLRFYHSGATDDLHTVVTHVAEKNYASISFVGFSLGGNLTLKYLGEREPHKLVDKAVVFSAPLDLKTTCEKISLPSNRIYANRFLRSLKRKVLVKSRTHLELATDRLANIKTLIEFDDQYTAPLHGFDGAVDYYNKCSSINFLRDITTPTLIVNTLNDPILSRACFPSSVTEGHPFVKLQVLARGGHVGFTQFNKNGLYWSEERAVHFFAGHARNGELS